MELESIPALTPRPFPSPDSAALKSSPSKKGRGALLAVKPLGPTAAFSASQIPSEREDVQYDLRGARSYPTLEDEGDLPPGLRHPGNQPSEEPPGHMGWGMPCVAAEVTGQPVQWSRFLTLTWLTRVDGVADRPGQKASS